MEEEEVNRLQHAFYFEMRSRPMAHSIVLSAVFCGVWALIFGARASRAFMEIGGDQIIVRILGGLLAVGGLLATIGTLRGRTMMELFGLSMTAAGAALYSLGVFMGLGVGGGIAGGLSFGLAMGCFFRVILVGRTAKSLARVME